jgi:biofilm PGA synthesis N-glycosyltransferase PgaC
MQPTSNARHVYVVITPVRNEAAFIERTIASMIAQTVRPCQWIIVDDGSTDDTADIIRRQIAEYPWIRLVQRADRGFRQRGGGVVEAFNEGYAALAVADYEFIVKLDGDLSFAPDYFERLLARFAARPRLGISGGTCYVQDGDTWRPEETDVTHVRGATKVYRRTCFEAIGGLVAHLGWDGVDEWQARARGWEVESFLDIPLYHHRATGAAKGPVRGRIEQGRAAYYIGYHPLFMLARGVRHMADHPFILGGLALLWGYVGDWLRRRERADDPVMLRFLHRNQLRRLGLSRFRLAEDRS